MVIPKKENPQKLEKKQKQNKVCVTSSFSQMVVVSFLFSLSDDYLLYIWDVGLSSFFIVLYKVEKENKWESSGTGGTRPTKMDIYERPA